MDRSKLVVFDVECYRNYFLIMFRKVDTGQIIYHEKFKDSALNIVSIIKLIKKYTVISFNGYSYDFPVIEAANKWNV